MIETPPSVVRPFAEGRATEGWVIDDESGALAVPLANLLAACHPGYGDPWGIGRVDLDDLINGGGECRHLADPDWTWDWSTHETCRPCHLARVRSLAIAGWPGLADDLHPVTIDVGVGDYIPSWPLLDGNHRVLAAWLRGDSLIEVSVAGDWDRAIALLIHGDDTAWYC